MPVTHPDRLNHLLLEAGKSAGRTLPYCNRLVPPNMEETVWEKSCHLADECGNDSG
jgi:hypothetical protein